jgi:hypothetical protein
MFNGTGEKGEIRANVNKIFGNVTVCKRLHRLQLGQPSPLFGPDTAELSCGLPRQCKNQDFRTAGIALKNEGF